MDGAKNFFEKNYMAGYGEKLQNIRNFAMFIRSKIETGY